MKKNELIFSVLFLLGVTVINAQNYSQGNNKLSVGGGLFNNGVVGELYYEKLFNQKLMPLRVGYMYHTGEITSDFSSEAIGINKHLGYVSVGYPLSELFQINNMGDTWQIYPTIGFTAGVETLDKTALENGLKIANQDGFVYGGVGGVNLEVYVFNSLFAVDLGYKFIYLMSDISNIQNNATIRIKFNL